MIWAKVIISNVLRKERLFKLEKGDWPLLVDVVYLLGVLLEKNRISANEQEESKNEAMDAVQEAIRAQNDFTNLVHLNVVQLDNMANNNGAKMDYIFHVAGLAVPVDPTAEWEAIMELKGVLNGLTLENIAPNHDSLHEAVGIIGDKPMQWTAGLICAFGGRMYSEKGEMDED